MADCGFWVFQDGANKSLELKSNRTLSRGNVSIDEIKNRKTSVSNSPIYLSAGDPGWISFKRSGGYGSFNNSQIVSDMLENTFYPKLLNSDYPVNNIGSIQITLTGFKALNKMGYVFTNLSPDANKESCKIESFTPNNLIYASEEKASIDAKPQTTDCIYGWTQRVDNSYAPCFEPINMDYWEFFNDDSTGSVIWLKDNCPDSIEVLETTYTKSYAIKTKMFFDYQVVEYF